MRIVEFSCIARWSGGMSGGVDGWPASASSRLGEYAGTPAGGGPFQLSPIQSPLGVVGAGYAPPKGPRYTRSLLYPSSSRKYRSIGGDVPCITASTAARLGR